MKSCQFASDIGFLDSKISNLNIYRSLILHFKNHPCKLHDQKNPYFIFRLAMRDRYHNEANRSRDP